MQADGVLATRLTLSGNEALEIDGDSHPHGLSIFLWPETPHADVHGFGAGLGRQASEEEGLLSEVIRLPALAFVRGEPGDEKLNVTPAHSDGLSAHHLQIST